MDQIENAVGPAPRCFVIGPIGNKFAPLGDPAREAYEEAIQVFEDVIMPACQALGIEPVRADQLARTGEITDQIFRRLFEDEVVIADVSGGNPNVMYELGLRHTRPLLTIQIGEFGQLPFDVSAVRTIQFSRSERGLIDARKALQRALEYGLADNGDPVSARRVWEESRANSAAVQLDEVGKSAPSAEPVDDDEDTAPGMLERMVAIETSMPKVTGIAEQIGVVVAEMGEVATGSSTEMHHASAGKQTASERLKILMQFAQGLQGPADRLTLLTGDFFNEMTALDDDLQGVFDYIERNPAIAREEDTESFLDAIDGAARSARDAVENVSQFGFALESLMGISSALRRPVSQVRDGVQRMVDAIALAERWSTRIQRIRTRLAEGEA